MSANFKFKENNHKYDNRSLIRSDAIMVNILSLNARWEELCTVFFDNNNVTLNPESFCPNCGCIAEPMKKQK